MAKKTPFLGLILPALSEFYNRWNVPVNDNFSRIDTFAAEAGSEITDARGSTQSLNDRLDVSINPDGTLKDVPEVAAARSSKIYGSGSGSTYQSLDDRLELADNEVIQARQDLSDLKGAMAFAADYVKDNCLVSGPTNPLTFSGAVVTLNGGTTKVISNINGYRNTTEINDPLTISGIAGTYHLFLDRNPNGKLFYTIPSTSGQTALLTSTGKLSKFKATGTNLVTSGVKPGHVLEITLPGANLNVGKWIVLETNVENPGDLANDEVRIIGEFNQSSTGLTATFSYPNAPTLGFTAVTPSKLWSRYTDRVYIGRCVFDGANVTGLTAYAYQGAFAEWFQVTPVSGDFSLNISHNLGFIPKRVLVYGSQANDFTQPLELLSFAKATQGSVSLDAGDQTVTYVPPALRRSVIARLDDTTIDIKNATNGIYYEDYAGAAQTNGYMYVVIER
jgi:hypothetical protein